jgi:general secretion pathway protein A
MINADSYLQYFGLKHQPFAPTADAHCFYATKSHRECLFRLLNVVDERQGIAVVLGAYGSGKTMLLRKLLGEMGADGASTIAPDRYNTAVIGAALPSWTSADLVEAIVAQLGLQPVTPTLAHCLEALTRHLMINHDRCNTLIIDDAQNLNKRGQLELLRLLQNLETPHHKLLNVILFATTDWMEVLRAAPAFTQRLNTAFTLENMSIEETSELILFRLKQARDGEYAGGGTLFDDSAVGAIYEYAGGNPRVTVTLCRNAMRVAAQIQSRIIRRDLIFHTIERAMPPDAEREARIAAAAEASAASAREDAGGEIEAEAAVGAGNMTMLPPLPNQREAKAARLLRAMKARH